MVEQVLERAQIIVRPDGRVDRKGAAEYLGMSPRTLADWHRIGRGPRSRLVGGRRFYMIDDLRAFAAGEGK